MLGRKLTAPLRRKKRLQELQIKKEEQAVEKAEDDKKAQEDAEDEAERIAEELGVK